LDPKTGESGSRQKEQWTVLQLLQSDLELVVKSGFLYLPLLYDPDIAREIQNGPTPGGAAERLLEVAGKHFMRAVSIQSILGNMERIDNGYYRQLQRKCLPQVRVSPTLEGISPDSKLMTLLLKVMPYFIKKNKGLSRKRLDDEEFLEFLSDRIDIPHSFREQVDKYFDSGPLRQTVNDLEREEQKVEPLHDGPISVEILARWLHKALEVQIVDEEVARLKKQLRDRERLTEPQRNHLCTLMYVAEKGALEIDGFGFYRVGSGDDYLVYKRTGEYVLKDYYARSYLFPDCRVAVPTMRPFKPMVLEPYKHPFLRGYYSQQEICMKEFTAPDEFTSSNIIRLLEEGINALLYGYDARRRNGYHSLDPTRHYIKTIEFEDYRINNDELYDV
jgi:hypothetical protein